MANRFSGTDPSEFDVGGDQRDELFDVLSNPRRRFILYLLQTAEMPVSVGELTTELTAWESQRQVPDYSADDRAAIEIPLEHNHLPKMAEAGLIDYDDTQQQVTLADRTDEVRAHLQTMASD
ncbi:DUF7344 domain-containing protein [Halomicrococcus sp. NG-SE-24]|uniref:DUF7344 domain-containing protein n=1 Tax=Halomicrococcus sp. NG-SE-24 TaxID=3436928 RepID=UPI003D95E1C6